MKFLVKAAVIAAALGGSALANADTFDFSYVFSDGQSVTGSLDGTLSGTTISNVNNLHVSLNGVAFTGGTVGPLALYGWNADDLAFEASAPAVVSTVASANNFAISNDVPFAGNPDYTFSFSNDPVYGRSVIAENFLAHDAFSGPDAGQLAIDPDNNGISGTWTITPVPIPAALPLLMSGLSVFGFARRRRRNV